MTESLTNEMRARDANVACLPLDIPHGVATAQTIEHALAHVIGDKAEQAYRRDDALERRKPIMDEGRLLRVRDVAVLGNRDIAGMTTIDLTGTSDRIGAHEVMVMERWPVACVLIWIRAVTRGWPMLEVCDHLRRALKMGERAFPIHDFPLEEGKALIDVAGASDAKLVLFHDGGKVEAWQLGPDSRLLPTKEPSGRNTFGLFPHPPIDLSTRLLGLWCQRQQVQSAWPHSPAAADVALVQGMHRADETTPVRRAVDGTRKRSRPPAYPWEKARLAVRDRLEFLGLPGPDSGDRKWRNQADVERLVAKFMIQTLGPDSQQPHESRVRHYVSSWISEWSADRQRS